eukprot:89234_1
MLSLLLISHLIAITFSYSLSSFTLQTSPPMPDSLHNMGLVVNRTSKEIWLFNGQSGTSWQNNIYRYSINDNAFYSHGTTPESMTAYAPNGIASVGDIIYFNHQTHSDIGSYNVNTQEWAFPMTPSLPKKVKEACLLTDETETFLFVIGGGGTNYFQIYDIENNTWLDQGPDMNEVRQYHSCQNNNGHIYVFGGSKTSGPFSAALDSIETIFVGSDQDITSTLSSSSWTLLSTKLNTARRHAASVICNQVDQELIYIIGGFTSRVIVPYYFDSIEVFNVTDHSIKLSLVRLREARDAASAACVDEYLYVFGGRDLSGSYDTWEISNPLYLSRITGIPTTEPSDIPSSFPIISSELTTNAPSIIYRDAHVGTSFLKTTDLETAEPITRATDKSMHPVVVAVIISCVVLILICSIRFTVRRYRVKSDHQPGAIKYIVDNEQGQKIATENKLSEVIGPKLEIVHPVDNEKNNNEEFEVIGDDEMEGATNGNGEEVQQALEDTVEGIDIIKVRDNKHEQQKGTNEAPQIVYNYNLAEVDAEVFGNDERTKGKDVNVD